MDSKRVLTRTVIYGLLSAGLYFLLYLFSAEIVAFSKQGRWFFIIPITIAFAFSIVHGNFTGHFWDLLGFKAKK